MAKEKPRAARRKTAIPARLDSAGGSQDVTIIDASQTGLLVRCTTPPRPGSEIAVLRRSQRIEGTVAWCRGRRIGIDSNEPIDVELLTGHATLGSEAAFKAKPKAEAVPRWWHWRSRD